MQKRNNKRQKGKEEKEHTCREGVIWDLDARMGAKKEKYSRLVSRIHIHIHNRV